MTNEVSMANAFDEAIFRKREQARLIEAKLERVREEYNAVKAELALLIQAKEIAQGTKSTPLTIAEATERILKSDPHPMRASDLLSILDKEYGISANLKGLVAGLRHDRLKRFIEVEPHTFGLNPNPLPITELPLHRKPQIEGLTTAIRKAIRSLGDKEFTAADVIEQIGQQDPKFARKVRQCAPSVSPTLKRMAKYDELILTEHGKGAKANTYKMNPEHRRWKLAQIPSRRGRISPDDLAVLEELHDELRKAV